LYEDLDKYRKDLSKHLGFELWSISESCSVTINIPPMDAEISGFIEEVETPLSNELLLLCFVLIESSLIASVVTMPEQSRILK
jgi:hypothetical protein